MTKLSIVTLSLLASTGLLAACGGSPAAPPTQPEESASTEAVDAPSSADPASTVAPQSSSEASSGAVAPATPSGAAQQPAGDADVDITKRSTASIAAIVKANRQTVRDCFLEARKTDKTLKGTLTIHFTINGEGKVTKAELNVDRSDIKNQAVVDCAIRTVTGLTFPPHEKALDTVTNYPFDLKP
jgi:hypothetical protein